MYIREKQIALESFFKAYFVCFYSFNIFYLLKHFNIFFLLKISKLLIIYLKLTLKTINFIVIFVFMSEA